MHTVEIVVDGRIILNQTLKKQAWKILTGDVSPERVK
jgi:hypothetical protein